MTESDSVHLELEAMRQIARALEMLDDPESRRRVLQWTRDRFQSAAQTAAPAASAQPAASQALEIEELDDLFVPDAAHPAPARPGMRPAAGPAKPARAGVEAMLRDFAADFRRFALEWQGT